MAGSSEEDTLHQHYFKLMQQRSTFIPVALNDPGLRMTFRDVHTGNQPAIFVGVTNEHYSEAKWDEDVHRIIQLFEISDLNRIGCIRLTEESDGGKIDATGLLRIVTEAIAVINKVTDKKIRIVGLGVAGVHNIYQALEALIKGWKVAVDQKKIQFVAVGEYDNYAYLNFCKQLCLQKLCSAVELYNTKDYNDFGYLNFHVKALYNLDPELLPRFLAGLSKQTETPQRLLEDLSNQTREPSHT